MVTPIYFGAKKLINTNGAIIISIVYSLLPIFIDYSRFLWNPNYQLALSPILVYLISKIRDGKLWLFLSVFWCGIMLQFHYMFILVIIALLILGIAKHKVIKSSIYYIILGFILGTGPLWLAELKNQFYTIQTLKFYLETLSNPGNDISVQPYYFLSVLLFCLIMMLYFLRKRLNIHTELVIFLLLLGTDLILYLPTPSHGFGMVKNWSYRDEMYANSLIQQSIKDKNIKNFNVVNLSYDTIAYVQKYLLLKSNITMNWEDYYHNDYPYIIDDSRKDYARDPSYEVSKFTPRKQIEVWKINSTHYLYLVKRII